MFYANYLIFTWFYLNHYLIVLNLYIKVFCLNFVYCAKNKNWASFMKISFILLNFFLILIEGKSVYSINYSFFLSWVTKQRSRVLLESPRSINKRGQLPVAGEHAEDDVQRRTRIFALKSPVRQQKERNRAAALKSPRAARTLYARWCVHTHIYNVNGTRAP